jgi:hypothetical protein
MKKGNIYLILFIVILAISCKKIEFGNETRNEFYLKNNTNNYYNVITYYSFGILPDFDPRDSNTAHPAIINKTLAPGDSINISEFTYKNKKLFNYNIRAITRLELYKSNNLYISFTEDSIYNYKVSLYNLNNWLIKEKYPFQDKDMDGNSNIYYLQPYIFNIETANIIEIK